MYNEALKLLNFLYENGYESYIIGGYVRDKILKIDSTDIDIVTKAKPDELSKLFNEKIEDNYGSMKLNYNGYKYEITTFRKEGSYIDNRRPNDIEYVETLKEDIQRRDFTINSIAIDKDGNYVDLLNGIEDIKNKIIRCIGNPEVKLKEDALRILRAIRFSVLYKFTIEDNLYTSIINNKDTISNLSFDRIKKELDAIFNSPNIDLFFNMINDLNLYKTLEIEAKNMPKTTNNYLSIWAQLEYSDKYNFSKQEKKYISDLKEVLKMGINSYTIYKYDEKIIEEANKILNEKDIDILYSNLPIKERKDINITYDEILNIVKDKSIINQLYIDLEKQILYNKLKNKKEDIISYIEGDIN